MLRIVTRSMHALDIYPSTPSPPSSAYFLYTTPAPPHAPADLFFSTEYVVREFLHGVCMHATLQKKKEGKGKETLMSLNSEN